VSDLGAFADQVAAADRDAGRLLAESAAGLAEAGASVTPVPRMPFHDRLHTIMGAELSAAGAIGQRQVCEHLGNLTAPSVSHWLASEPARGLLCASCAEQVTVEASCALCGAESDLFVGAHRLPATTLERDGQSPVSTAIMVHWIACQGCLTAE
jgi:hypothetical protein